MIKWQEIFSKDGFHWQDAYTTSEPVVIARLDELKRFLDAVHIRFCLVKPYQEHKNYPLVESRELLPSFDNDMFEYKDLPGFSMVAFARQLDYFSETFQFDKLHPIVMEADGACCPLENQVLARNVQTLASPPAAHAPGHLPPAVRQRRYRDPGQLPLAHALSAGHGQGPGARP